MMSTNGAMAPETKSTKQYVNFTIQSEPNLGNCDESFRLVNPCPAEPGYTLPLQTV